MQELMLVDHSELQSMELQTYYKLKIQEQTVEVTGSMSVSGGFDNNIDFNSTSNLGPESNVTITGGVAVDAFLQNRWCRYC